MQPQSTSRVKAKNQSVNYFLCRSSVINDAIKLSEPKRFTIEETLEFINDDELVEITPAAIRLCEKYLNERERKHYNKGLMNQ